MGYWLLKSEPDVFSIDDLARVGREPWSGVRNYQARNFMRDQMRVGELALFYHSNAKPAGAYGLMRIGSEAYADPTQFEVSSEYFDPKSRPEAPRWQLVDVCYVQHLPRPVTLDAMRSEERLSAMRLLQRGNRLSILPLEREELRVILELSGMDEEAIGALLDEACG